MFGECALWLDKGRGSNARSGLFSDKLDAKGPYLKSHLNTFVDLKVPKYLPEFQAAGLHTATYSSLSPFPS